MYWALQLRAELGLFHVVMLLFGVALVAFLLFAVDVWVSEKFGKKAESKSRPPRGALLRLPIHIAIGVVAALSILGLGRPVGGLVVFDQHGNPQRATMQVIVQSGGKSKVEHVMLRAFGPDGATRGVLRTEYASSRRRLPASAAFWAGDVLRSMETLEVLMSGEQVRASVPALTGTESRLLRVDDDTAVFERKDGKKVSVTSGEVLGNETLGPIGCRFDITFRRSQKVEGLIRSEFIPWPDARDGCPSAPPAGLALFRSSDAAYGEQQTLITLRDGETTRWQAPLAAVTASEDATLLGAFPGAEALTVVAAADDELVFARLGWADGAVSAITRWR